MNYVRTQNNVFYVEEYIELISEIQLRLSNT